MSVSGGRAGRPGARSQVLRVSRRSAPLTRGAPQDRPPRAATKNRGDQARHPSPSRRRNAPVHAHEPSCLPRPAVSLHPRRCVPPTLRPVTVNDRLLRHVVARLVPADRPHPCRRPAPRTTSTAKAAGQRPSLRTATRRWNDLLGIWRQCDERDCRRRRRCCGDPLSCLPRFLPLLPQSARLWFACIGSAAENGVSFAEALASATRDGDEAACVRWHAAVRHALMAPRAPRRP